MRRTLSLLLVLALMLSMVTSAFAVEGTEGGEQPQDQESQTTVTVGTLEELETAIAAAEDGDTIAISAEITLDGVALETDKDITIVRADTYESGSFFRLKNSALLSGFTMENYKSSTTVMCDSAAEIKHCSFVGDVEITDSFIKAYMLFPKADVVISDCSFSGALYSAIRSNPNCFSCCYIAVFPLFIIFFPFCGILSGGTACCLASAKGYFLAVHYWHNINSLPLPLACVLSFFFGGVG